MLFKFQPVITVQAETSEQACAHLHSVLTAAYHAGQIGFWMMEDRPSSYFETVPLADAFEWESKREGNL